MLLVIDVGNTTIEFGIFDGEKLVDSFRKSSKQDFSSDEAGLFMVNFFEHRGLDFRAVTGAVISSVVPQVNYSLTSAVKKYFGLEPYIIGENLFCNMPNLYGNPSEVGVDRLVDSYAAVRKYGGPLIVVDFGTATTCDAVSEKGEYLGGLIYPGIRLSIDSLYEKASKLPKIELVKPEMTIGKCTVSSMQSGLYFGYLGATQKMVANLKEIIGQNAKVIATGGFSRLFEDEPGLFDFVDRDLPLDGMRMVYEAREQEV